MRMKLETKYRLSGILTLISGICLVSFVVIWLSGNFNPIGAIITYLVSFLSGIGVVVFSPKE